MSVVRRLQLAGVLPVAFEASTGGPSDAVLRGVLGGAVVAPGGRETERPRAPWALTVLSIGADRVEASSPLAGRVFQSTAPSSTAVDPAHDAAIGHYGWPFVWWARSDVLADVVGEHARAVEVLREGSWERRGAVAAMGLGMNALGRLVGRERPLDADVADLGRGLSRGGG